MNSLLYYYNNVQKMAAYRQAKNMQRGVKLGYMENSLSTTSKRFLMPPINIGLSDYSIEYFGNAIGSNISAPYIRNSYIDEPDFILSWGYVDINGIDYIRFGNNPDGTVNQVNVNFKSDNDAPFHLVITRQGLQIKIYVNDSLYGQLTTNKVFDMKNIELIFINSSNIGFVRVWNYALSADEIATLYNNGDPMGYVVPKARRGGLLAEYLPQNLMYGRDDKAIATSWLDSAKQMPLSDEYMEPLFQSIGGYDMAANGAPEILYNE